MSGNSKKTAVSQADLRKLMSGSVNKTGGGSKRYKVSAREQALMEEQRRAKLAEKEKKAAKASAAAAALAATLPASDAKPVKSILKKSAVVPNTPSYQPPVKSFLEPPPPPPPSSALATTAPSATPDTSLTVAPSSLTPSSKPQEDAESKGGALPEGFFDDPIMDAKARGVAYVDKEEEEWEAFQKEIEAEETVAQNILVEDRTEATADRQIEEIDEQIEAWQRVNRLEKLKDEVESKLKPSSKLEIKQDAENSDESDEDLDDVQDFVDWRNKC